MAAPADGTWRRGPRNGLTATCVVCGLPIRWRYTPTLTWVHLPNRVDCRPPYLGPGMV